jgi:hypothetical protein
MVKGNKGFLRIVEAGIAIMIILVALLLFTSDSSRTEKDDLSARIVPILEEIAQNNSLRRRVLNYSLENPDESENDAIIGELENFVGGVINNPSLNYSVRICELKTCAMDYPSDIKGNLYSAERVISTDVRETDFYPRKVKIFLWNKEFSG